MPVLDVKKLKKSRGERIEVTCHEKLPPLPVESENIKPLGEAGYQLLLTNAGNAVAVEGTIQVNLVVQCSRCLDSFVYPMEIRFQEIYYDRNLPQPGGVNPDWVPFTGDQIDITPEVVQNILVNLPMRFICRENCRGLCPVCGVDLNNVTCACKSDEFNPQMGKLKHLLK